MKRLTESQGDDFNRDGFLAIEDFLTPDQLATVRQAVDDRVQEAQSLTQTNETFDLEDESDGGRVVVRRIFNPSQVDPRFEQIALDEDVLDVVEDLIGPNIELHHGKINMKAGRLGSEVCWHQDVPFFPHTNSSLLAIMFYLDDADEENGCLSVVPASHRLGPLDHHADGEFIGMVTSDMDKIDPDEVINVPMRAGGITIHHCLTLHSSAPNTSARQRRVLIYQFRACDAAQLTPDASKGRHYGRLLRGEQSGKIRCEAMTYRIPSITDRPRSLYQLQQEYKRKNGAGEERC